MKILIGMRGGLGDVVLYTSVLKSFRKKFKDAHIICGTSFSCEEIVRSIPFFDEVFVDFRPRYMVNRTYRDRRTGFKIENLDKYYCLDHPYRNADEATRSEIHIIDMASRLLGVENFERKATVYIKDSFYIPPFVAISPFCSQKIKIPPSGLFREIASNFENCFCVLPDSQMNVFGCAPLCEKSILKLATILKNAEYYIGLDSGISHIVSAFGIPMTTIHIGYSPKRSGVLSEAANVMFFPDRNITNWKTIISKILVHYESTRTCIKDPVDISPDSVFVQRP